MSTYRQVVEEVFGGLSYGCHRRESRKACAVEAAAYVKGMWTDDEKSVGLPPGLTLLNDTFIDDQARTEALVPVVEASWEWDKWSNQRRLRFIKMLTRRMTAEFLPTALRLIGQDSMAEEYERLAGNVNEPYNELYNLALTLRCTQQKSSHCLVGDMCAAISLALYCSTPNPTIFIGYAVSTVRSLCRYGLKWQALASQACQIWAETAREVASLSNEELEILNNG